MPIIGVYEQEHIAAVVSIGVRDVRTASVVTRYWGAPPDLGRVMHGSGLGVLGHDSCGNESGSWGDVSRHWVTSEGEERGLPRIQTETGFVGSLTVSEEAALMERFGPRHVPSVSSVTRVAAWVQLWWLPGLLLGLVIGPPLAVRRLRRRAARRSARS